MTFTAADFLAAAVAAEIQGEDSCTIDDGAFGGFLTRALFNEELGTTGGEDKGAWKSGAGISRSEKRRTLGPVADVAVGQFC